MQIETQSTVGSSIFEADSDLFPVKVEPSSSGTLKIWTLDSGKYIGLASLTSSPTICKLMESTEVVLTATLVVPNARQRQYIQATLRIVIYGLMSEKHVVAKTLSDGDLYLQHPSLSECDTRVPYFNPQYFLRPGSHMPKLENLVISGRGKSGRGASDSLAEIERSRLLQVFESAYDPDSTFGIQPSSRLQSDLKEYVAS